MQYILLLAILGGCAASMDELIVEAKECVDQSTNLQGVIGATGEQRQVCWAPVNDRIEARERAEERREKREGPSCGKGLIAWCDWTGCRCVTKDAVRRAFEGRH